MTFPLLRISSAALAAAALAGSLAGCAPLVIGGGAVVGTLMATDRRTTGTQVGRRHRDAHRQPHP